MKRIFYSIGLAVLMALLAACGGPSTASSPAPQPQASTLLITGALLKGGISGATVNVYAYDAVSGLTGTQSLGSAQVANDGSFAITLSPAPSGPIVLDATGGNYVNLAYGDTIQQTSHCGALLAQATSGQATVYISPLSDMVLQRSSALVVQGQALSSAYAQATAELKAEFGSDLTGVGLNYNLQQSLDAQNGSFSLYMVLTAFDAFVHESSATTANIDATYTELSEDFADDGRLNASGNHNVFGDSTYPGAGRDDSGNPYNPLGYQITGILQSVAAAAANDGSNQPLAYYEVRDWSASATVTYAQRQVDGLIQTVPGYSCPATDTQGHPLQFVYLNSSNITDTRVHSSGYYCWDGRADAQGNAYFGPYRLCPDGSFLSATDTRTCAGGLLPADYDSIGTLVIYNASLIASYQAPLLKALPFPDQSAMTRYLQSSAKVLTTPFPNAATQTEIDSINAFNSALSGFFGG